MYKQIFFWGYVFLENNSLPGRSHVQRLLRSLKRHITRRLNQNEKNVAAYRRICRQQDRFRWEGGSLGHFVDHFHRLPNLAYLGADYRFLENYQDTETTMESRLMYSTQMRSISIQCSERKFRDGDGELPTFIRPRSFADIRDCRIAYATASDTRLLSFIISMSQRAEVIEFRRVFVNDNRLFGWVNVLSHSRNFGFPNLKSFVLDSCSTSGSIPHCIQDYTIYRPQEHRWHQRFQGLAGEARCHVELYLLSGTQDYTLDELFMNISTEAPAKTAFQHSN